MPPTTAQTNPTTPPANNAPMPATTSRGWNKWVKLTIGFITIAAALALIFAALSFTRVDNMIMKVTLSGRVTDESGNPVTSATIKLAGKTASTNASGNYSIADLTDGSYELQVTAAGYRDATQQVQIQSQILNYNQQLDIKLTSTKAISINGKLIASDKPGYQFVDDRILINNIEFKVNTDGTFTGSGLSGKNIIQVSSANYVDNRQELDIKESSFTLPEITLTPAGDFMGSIKSYISEKPVTDLTIAVEGVSTDQISIDPEKQQFRIKDLQVGREYQVRITHADYIARDYTQTAQQGEAALFNLKIVEKDKVTYLQKADRDLQVFASNLDGTEAKQLTQNRMEPYGEYIDAENIVYFLSTRDAQSSKLGGKALIAYAVNLTGGNAQRITTDIEGLGEVRPNFRAKILTNLTTTTNDRSNRVLQKMDLVGNNRVELFNLNQGEIHDVRSNKDGSKITFAVNADDNKLDGLYYFNTSTAGATAQRLTDKLPIQIFDISDSGRYIIYSVTGSSENLLDLYLFDIQNSSNRRLRSAFTGTQYQFIHGSENDVIFYEQRTGNTNVFKLDLDGNSDQPLTQFRGSEAIEAVYQQNGYILYQTNVGLYAMHPASPKPGKLVTKDVARYTGYDF